MRTRLRRTPHQSSAGSHESSDLTVGLDDVLDGRRPGPADPARDRTWLAVRSEADSATAGGRFDIRRALDLEGPALTTWRERRRGWLAQWFADDPRVTVAHADRQH